MSEESDDGQLLRAHLFDADLIELPPPDEGLPDFLPPWFRGSLPVLVYPPLSERGVRDGDNIDLQITPFHLYYGALRELAETADADRSSELRRLVLEWNPNAAREACELGREQIGQDLETALLHYELALEIDEGLHEAAQDGGMCQYALASVGGEDRSERLTLARDLFQHAIELDPASGLSCWSLARALHDLGDLPAADECLRRFLDERPDAEQREMVEDALANGFPAVEPAVDEQRVFAQAQALAFGGDPRGAIELLQPLAEKNPDTADIWFVLGAAHRRVNEIEEAERCLRRAVRLMPDEPFLWMELGAAYMAVSQWRSAEEALRRALELEPENPGYLCDLGRVLLAQGDREGAEESLNRAAELVPDDPTVREALAELDRN